MRVYSFLCRELNETLDGVGQGRAGFTTRNQGDPPKSLTNQNTTTSLTTYYYLTREYYRLLLAKEPLTKQNETEQY